MLHGTTLGPRGVNL